MPRKDTGFPTDPAMRERQRTLLVGHFTALLDESQADAKLAFWGGSTSEVENIVDRFLALWPNRPIQDNTGGSGFNDSLSLFLLATLSKAEQVIESGTHRGHSAWLLREALPEAEIDSFDLNHSNLVHRAADVRFHEQDWTEAEIAASPSSLIFFDDHMNHGRRILEAHARGFRHLILDDNMPAHALFATGTPPVPTLDMILDTSLSPDQRFTWKRNGKQYEGVLDGKTVEQVRPLIAASAVLPDLADITLYGPQSRMTAVSLKSG